MIVVTRMPPAGRPAGGETFSAVIEDAERTWRLWHTGQRVRLPAGRVVTLRLIVTAGARGLVASHTTMLVVTGRPGDTIRGSYQIGEEHDEDMTSGELVLAGCDYPQ